MASRRAFVIMATAALWSAWAAPTLAQAPNAATVAGKLDKVNRFIALINRKQVFIQKEGDGYRLVKLDEVDSDVSAQEMDLDLDGSPQAREAARRIHAENLEREVNRRHGETRRLHLPVLEEQRRELEAELAKLGGPPPVPDTPSPAVWPDPMDWQRVQGRIVVIGINDCFDAEGALPRVISRWTLQFIGDGTVQGTAQVVEGDLRGADLDRAPTAPVVGTIDNYRLTAGSPIEGGIARGTTGRFEWVMPLRRSSGDDRIRVAPGWSPSDRYGQRLDLKLDANSPACWGILSQTE